MICLRDENAIRDSFRDLDQSSLELPSGLTFPLILRDYMSWVESSGARVFLLFRDRDTGRARGVVFERNAAGPEGVAHMCEWCHSVRGSQSVGLLSAAAGARQRVGLYLCRDLSCKEKISGVPGANDVHESLTRQEKLARILGRMTEFARRHLF